jgi:transmembrane sensor
MNDAENIIPLPGRDDIEAEAASWLTVLGRECVAEADIYEFNQWLNQSDRHRVVFKELAALWDDLEVLKELDDIAESATAEIEPVRPVWQRWQWMSIAASFVIAVMVAGLFYTQLEDYEPESGSYITQVGEQRTLRLSDNSLIQMNTDTRVKVNYTKANRTIELLQGEAHFDVAKNKQRPFYVYVGGGLVHAVGTAFTVRLRVDDEVEVTVEEGRVALVPLNKSEFNALDRSQIEATKKPLTELTVGQSAVFGKRVEQIEHMQPTELNRKLSWRQGMLAYSDQPLLDVVDDVSRYTDVTIEITDPKLRALPIAGYFKVGEIEGLLDSLELTFGLHVERISEKHVRLSADI